MDKMISISEASEILGIDIRTLQRWDKDGKLKAYRTLGKHRRYKLSEIEALINSSNIMSNNTQNIFVYCRVSTKKQCDSGNLQRQKERLLQYCNDKGYKSINVFEEVASGINDNRRELIKMFRRLKEVDKIIIEYPDRLARFGFNYLKEFAKSFNVEIETVENNKSLDPNEEMVQDLVSIVTCFSARLYGARGGRKVKVILDNLERERQGELNHEDYSESSID